MTDEPTDAPTATLADQVRLVSIDPIKTGPYLAGHTVKLRLDLGGGDPYNRLAHRIKFDATFPADMVRDEGLIALARADLHRLCLELAEATKAWALTSEQRTAMAPAPQGRPELTLILD